MNNDHCNSHSWIICGTSSSLDIFTCNLTTWYQAWWHPSNVSWNVRDVSQQKCPWFDYMPVLQTIWLPKGLRWGRSRCLVSQVATSFTAASAGSLCKDTSCRCRGWNISSGLKENQSQLLMEQNPLTLLWNLGPNEEKLERYTAYILLLLAGILPTTHTNHVPHHVPSIMGTLSPQNINNAGVRKTRLPSGCPFQRVCCSNPERKPHLVLEGEFCACWNNNWRV